MIIYISRTLTNILDEGSKNLVTNLLKHITMQVIVFTDDSFDLKLSESVQPIKISQNTLTDNTVKIRTKIVMLKTILKYNKKLVYAHYFFTLTKWNSIAILFLSHLMKIEFFITVPVIIPDELKSKFTKFTLKKATKVIVFTEYSKRILSEYTDRVVVIPPTVHPKFYKTEKIRSCEKKLIKSKLKISSDYIILFPGEYGRLDSNENIINIIREVNNADKQILFILSCRLKKEADAVIREYARNRLIGANVLFLNTVPNYSEYLCVADLTIFPVKSMHGKFDLPLSLVESIVAGTPVLFSDMPPLNELYGCEQYIRIDKEDWSGFADMILKLRNDPLLYQQYRNITLAAAAQYEPERILEQYESLYKK